MKLLHYCKYQFSHVLETPNSQANKNEQKGVSYTEENTVFNKVYFI